MIVLDFFLGIVPGDIYENSSIRVKPLLFSQKSKRVSQYDKSNTLGKHYEEESKNASSGQLTSNLIFQKDKLYFRVTSQIGFVLQIDGLNLTALDYLKLTA